jgi:hypothetical protein
VFFLAYHLHWGHSEIVDLSTDERWEYIRLLSEQMDREKEALEQAKQT